MAQIWQHAHGHNRGVAKSVVNDRPSLQNLTDGGVRLEMNGRDSGWIIELTEDECERIAEAIGCGPPAACDD